LSRNLHRRATALCGAETLAPRCRGAHAGIGPAVDSSSAVVNARSVAGTLEYWITMTHILCHCAVACAVGLAAPAQAYATFTETILASFDGSAGKYPIAGLLRDGAGNLYGVTPSGGTFGFGTVFKLAPPPAGAAQWTLTTLYNFSGPDGSRPRARLVMDKSGNLFGTTVIGGTNGIGTVFELIPPAPGQTSWTETVLTSFGDANAGSYPYGGVVLDQQGNLYGTLAGYITADFIYRGGAIFKLSPPGYERTAWTETVIDRFTGANGDMPLGSLILDAAGNLYGTASEGGPQFDGVVFKLSPPAAGKSHWAETILTSFAGSSIGYPFGTLVFDAAGNLYGTTYYGGAPQDCGAVFRLSPPAKDLAVWNLKQLWAFNGSGDGCYPDGNLVLNAAGSLFGTTSVGQAFNTGLVFELSPPASGNGAWSYGLVHRFAGPNQDGGNDGFYPSDDLVIDNAGNLYGTEIEGTAGVYGLVFELTPANIAPR
jgi:uncharacterized repeat protein (TIGR03803 family)